MTWPSREQAFHILTEYTKSASLIKHAIAVEAVMRALASRYSDDEELYGLVGLLHDFDYEAFPEIGQHTIAGGKILAERGFPPIIIEAIQSHVTENGIARDTRLKQSIYAADELTGFIIAATLVRPQKSLSDLTPKSVVKKLKDKSFARGVNRNEVYQGVEGLGVPLPEFIQFIIDTLKPLSKDIGLNPP